MKRGPTLDGHSSSTVARLKMRHAAILTELNAEFDLSKRRALLLLLEVLLVALVRVGVGVPLLDLRCGRWCGRWCLHVIGDVSVVEGALEATRSRRGKTSAHIRACS